MRLLENQKDYITALGEIQKADPVLQTMYGLVTGGTLQVSDHAFVGAKDISSLNLVKLLDPSDTKNTGINNLSNAKPQPNQMMLCTAIKLLAYQGGAAITDQVLRTANYGELTDVAGLVNALITVKSDSKILVNQLPMSCFLIGNRRDEKGLYHLHFPKPIYPDREIYIEIDFGKGAAPANSAVKWELRGPTTGV